MFRHPFITVGALLEGDPTPPPDFLSDAMGRLTVTAFVEVNPSNPDEYIGRFRVRRVANTVTRTATR